jgi:membrane protease YdiL (CAAX protease family)
MCVAIFESWGFDTPNTGEGIFKNGFWFAFFVYAVLPPIYEELIFRFGVCKGLQYTKLKEIWIILISAAVFAVYHHSFSQLVYQFIMGAVFAKIYIKTDSIFYTMFIHFINNAFIITYTYFNSGGGVFVLSFGSAALSVGLAVIAAAAVYFLIKGLPNGRRNKK